MCPTKDCIFYEGHGGEHFIAQDGKDQSDEIRLRILRDKVAQLKAEAAALRSENASLRNRLGDNLCWLDELERPEAERAKALPEGEFLESCRRFHAQVAQGLGVFTGGLTIAQLEAEVRRLTLEADRSESLMQAQDQAIVAGLAWEKKARSALKRYGRHLDSCCDDERACTCGLDAVLGAEKP